MPCGSFWWRVVLKQLDNFKGIAMVHLQDGSTILLWQDMWADKVRCHCLVELYFFTTGDIITLQQARSLNNLHDIFQLPLSEVAFDQYIALSSHLDSLSLTDDKDIWSYI
jgi:hypothetical protein